MTIPDFLRFACNNVQCWLCFPQDASWGDDGVIYFEPHSRAITSMAFSSHPCNLITVSYDGSARSMDLENAVFDEVKHWSYMFMIRHIMYSFLNVIIAI